MQSDAGQLSSSAWAQVRVVLPGPRPHQLVRRFPPACSLHPPAWIRPRSCVPACRLQSCRCCCQRRPEASACLSRAARAAPVAPLMTPASGYVILTSVRWPGSSSSGSRKSATMKPLQSAQSSDCKVPQLPPAAAGACLGMSEDKMDRWSMDGACTRYRVQFSASACSARALPYELHPLTAELQEINERTTCNPMRRDTLDVLPDGCSGMHIQERGRSGQSVRCGGGVTRSVRAPAGADARGVAAPRAVAARCPPGDTAPSDSLRPAHHSELRQPCCRYGQTVA